MPGLTFNDYASAFHHEIAEATNCVKRKGLAHDSESPSSILVVSGWPLMRVTGTSGGGCAEERSPGEPRGPVSHVKPYSQLRSHGP